MNLREVKESSDYRQIIVRLSSDYRQIIVRRINVKKINEVR
ncbi:MAG: hypothetical protein KFBDDELM_00117 [Candidatus Argoarchaeum ethanivorans]|uniref:Uncharacterized protein n=1 Tax=Candidatus Argoarchaeum ethanivorans TaxID=2608793 RepID=A0A811T4H1_9EURY|nr:MAG: hypothetical protein KFBDDELM_00117 [Candidatus Argoarchaeum ethanivorans]